MSDFERRRLGRTGLSVTALGFGAMDLGRPPAVNEISDDEPVWMLNAVLDSGINFIDTAVCDGTSEVMPIPQCIASRFSLDRPSRKGCVRCSSVPVTRRSARLGAILAGLLFAGGAFAHTPGDALPKPDAEPMAPAAGPTTPVADPTTPAAKPTRNYDRFYFQTSLFTAHFHPDPKHNNHNHVLDAEYRFDKEWYGGRWIAGAAVFDNSFGQPSQYVYGGWMYPIPRHESFYITLSAGVLHGYKPPYQDKILYNHDGYAPGFVSAAGYCYRKVCSEIILFGSAGVMLTLGLAIH